MRLPQNLAGASTLSSPASIPSNHATSVIARIASSPLGASAFYVIKSIFIQQQQPHSPFLYKRDPHVDTRHQWVVDLVLCVLSFLGALTIIVPYCLTKHSRKLRHSLILGLATSDLASSAIIIGTTSVSLAGGNLTHTVRFCQFSGYTFQVAIWTQNLWNLSIAIITYMILVHPLSSFNSWVERNLVWFWPVFWSISFAINAVGWPVTNFGNVGGYCSFAANRGGAYFAAVFQFVPRAFVVCVILVLYTHLFFFLRRVNMFNQANTTRQMSSAVRSRDSSRQRRISMPNEIEGEAKTSDEALVSQQHPNSTDRRWSALYKFKRTLSQSTFSPRGGMDSPRQGSGSSQGKASSGVSKTGDQQEVPILKMDDYSMCSPKSKSIHINDTPPSPTSSKKMPPVVIPIIKAPSSSYRVGILDTEQNCAPTQRRGSTAHFDLPDDDEEEEGEGEEAEEEENDEGDDDGNEKRSNKLHGLLDILQPMPIRRDFKDFGMTSSPREHLKHYSLSAAGVDYLKKAKEGEASESNDRTLTGMDNSNTEVPTYETALGQDWTWGMAVGGGGEGGEKEFKSNNPTSPISPSRKQFRHFGSRRQSTADHIGTGTNNSSSTDENGVESLGSTLNRQASILLLLYPAAYCILFSIPIIRIIVDISNPDGSAASKAQRNENLLHAISRWTIFAQGVIDALVFQFVERSFRMRMKRKRRIAAGEIVPDFWYDVYLKTKALFKRKSKA